MLYTKVNSHVTREFGLSCLTKIEEHTCVTACECQLRHELYCITDEMCAFANFVKQHFVPYEYTTIILVDIGASMWLL